MNTRDKKKSYSDLEAIVVDDEPSHAPNTGSATATTPAGRTSYWNEKFAISDPSRSANPFSDDKAGAMSPIDSPLAGPPAYYLVDSKGQTQALYAAPASDAKDQPPMATGSLGGIGGAGILGGRRERTTIFGLRRSTFYALTAGTACFVIGILVTILAVTAPWSKAPGGGGSGAGASRPPAAGVALPSTRLAAMNWTDATGTSYTGVFYQSSNETGSAIMAAIREDGTDSWTSVNVSQSANAAGLDVLEGTPLAAVSNNGLWNVFYLASDRTVAELYSASPASPTGWLQGGLTSQLNGPRAAPGSGLAAVLQNCRNCTNSLLLLYQDNATGDVQMANMTSLKWTMGDVVSASAAPGTGLAISAFVDFGGTGPTGTDPNSLRMYLADGGNLIEKIKGPLTDYRVETGNFGTQITANLAVNPSPEMASLTFGANGWTNNIVMTLDQTTGALQSAVYRGTDWAVQAPTLVSAPQDAPRAGFSAVALTQEMRMFVLGRDEGTISEYQTTMANPFRWEWQGIVGVPGAQGGNGTQ